MEIFYYKINVIFQNYRYAEFIPEKFSYIIFYPFPVQSLD